MYNLLIEKYEYVILGTIIKAGAQGKNVALLSMLTLILLPAFQVL